MEVFITQASISTPLKFKAEYGHKRLQLVAPSAIKGYNRIFRAHHFIFGLLGGYLFPVELGDQELVHHDVEQAPQGHHNEHGVRGAFHSKEPCCVLGAFIAGDDLFLAIVANAEVSDVDVVVG